MRKIFIIFVCWAMLLPVYAQNVSTKSKGAQKAYLEAVSQMRMGRNKEAVKGFRDAIDKDKYFVEAFWLLAETYKAMGNEDLRISTLQRATNKNFPRVSETYQRMAMAQYENGLYKDAQSSFSSIAEADKNSRIVEWIEKCKTAQDLRNHPVPFDPKNLGAQLNTIYDDYWPSITADEQTLSMTVLYGKLPGSNVTMGIHEEIYHSKKVNGVWTKSQNIGAPMNTYGNEGAQTFSFDGQYMFFVACDRRAGMGGCDIYYSIKKGEIWTEPINPGEPLNSKYWETSPSFSAAGNELFFSSNRPGGKGNKDIWKCKVNIGADGKLTFSDPVNLGFPVNTEGDEFSPFIHADNKTLYFSSTGHAGLGGYDIYLSRREDGKSNTWSQPKNLGYPINTHRDEMGFVVNARGDKAYFSSDGIENNGRGKDIYEIVLYDAIRPEPVKYFKGNVYDYDKKEPIQAQVELYRLEDDEVVYKSVSDSETGNFMAALPADKEYGFHVSKKNYIFHSGHFGEGDTTEIRISKDIELPRIEKGRSVILKNVFFDFDLYDLKPKSKAELDRVYDFLLQNTRVKLELAGHTDSKGSDDYNQKLSEHRARAVYNYLIKKGIARERLTFAGYGAARPIATNDTEAGRALNRRTEAIITDR